MDKPSIPHDAFVFIGDGRKALFMRNYGDEKYPHLKVERVLSHPNPPTREQGSDRPGRSFKRAATNYRSSTETTDWHVLEEQRFAREVADALAKLVRSKAPSGLVVVAPPRTLADLRAAYNPEVKKKIIAEIEKDLTKHPTLEIEKHLFG